MAKLIQDDLSGSVIDGLSYQMQFTRFTDEGKMLKCSYDIGHATFTKIVGDKMPEWQTWAKIDGKWQITE